MKIDIKIKKTLSKVWIPIFFASVATIMIGMFTSSLFNPFKMNSIIFCCIGIIAVSTRYIYRYIIKKEVFSLANLLFFIFIIFSFLNLYLKIEYPFFRSLTSITGFASLFFIEKNFLGKVFKLHSSNVILTGFLFTVFFSNNYYAFFLVALIKLVLYIYRKYRFYKKGISINYVISAIRIDLLITIPFIIMWIDSDLFIYISFISVAISEIFDRFELHYEQRIENVKIENNS